MKLLTSRPLQGLGVLLFVAVVFGPLLALLAQLGRAALAGQVDWPQLGLLTGRQMALLLRSLGLAGAVSVGGVALGLLAATALWQWPGRAGAYLAWFVLVLAPIPPYIHATVWTEAAYALNSWLQAHGFGAIPLRGWGGSWYVQLMAVSPLAVGLALVGLEMVEPRLIEAARLVRPDLQVLAKVVLPLAAPAILAGAGLLFVLSLMDYSVPSLFSVNVYSLEVFAEYSASSDPASALLLALPLLLAALVVILASQSVLRSAASTHARGRRPGGGPACWPGWFAGLQWLALAILLGQFIVIVVGLAAAVGSPRDLTAALLSARREIAFTLGTALLAAVLCLPLALLAAEGMARGGARGWLWCLLVTAPLAIPAPLIGIGLITLCSHPAFPHLYGTIWLPTLAALARFTPFAAFVVLAQVRRIDPLLVDAARMLQARGWQTWSQVLLPLLAPGLLAAACLTFALSAGELAATLIVAPPGWATLTMRIYNYLHYGAAEEVAGLCLMMAAMALVAGLLAVLALTRWSRLLPGASSEARS